MYTSGLGSCNTTFSELCIYTIWIGLRFSLIALLLVVLYVANFWLMNLHYEKRKNTKLDFILLKYCDESENSLYQRKHIFYLLSSCLFGEGLSSQSPRTSIKPGGKATMSPSTPPPSPTPGEGEEETLRPDTTLVTITISTIDKKCPEFHSKYDGVSMIWCFVFLIEVIAVLTLLPYIKVKKKGKRW